jgi:hypothetical protein
MAQGGYLGDLPGPKGVDSGLIAAAKGEYVVRASAVDRIGVGTLDAINEGRDMWGARPLAPPRASISMPSSSHVAMTTTTNITVTIRWPDGTVAGRIVAAGVQDHGGNAATMKAIRGEVAGRGSGDVNRAFGNRSTSEMLNQAARHAGILARGG